MAPHFYSVVWIDHRDARICHFNATADENLLLQSKQTGLHAQHRAHVAGSGHQGVDTEFFARVAHELTHSGALIITGPGTAKSELKNYLNAHYPVIEQRIAAVTPMDHPKDAEILKQARDHFKTQDPMYAKRP